MIIKRMTFLIFLFVSLISCGNKTIPESDTLVLAIGGENTEGYDPVMGWGRYGHPLFHSTLLKYDENLKIIYDLAKSYLISKNGLVWTVEIRTDAQFSNGKELTANDVAYTFNKAKESAGKVDMSMLDHASEKGKYKVEFKLKYPYILFLNKLLTLGIVPEDIHSSEGNYGRNPVGSGPYKFISWYEGQQLIVEVNPYYYGKKPSIKKIIFLFMDEDTSFAAARAGNVHVVALPYQYSKQKIKNMAIHPVKSVDNRGIVFPYIPDTGKKTEEGYSIGNNVTCDIAIRKAVNYAVNRKLLADTILEGYGEPAYGIADNLPWDNSEIRIKDSDITRARKILADAGWKDTDNDGIVEKNGLKAEFDLLYFSNDSTRQQLSLAVADMAAKAGIKINVTGRSSDDVVRYNHSCAVLYGFGSHSPEEMFNMYHSKFAGTEAYNAGFYKNPVVDKYLDRATSSLTFESSFKYWKMAQWDGNTGCSVKGDAVWAWLVNLTHVYFVADNLDVGKSKIEPHGHGWPITANIEKWKWKDK